MIFSLLASLFMNSVQLIIFPERVKVVVRYNWSIFCLCICLRRVDWLKIIVLKRNHKQWLSTIPPVSTKRTITAHILPQNTKTTTTYDVSNPDPGLGQRQKCGGVYWISPMDNWFSNFFFIISHFTTDCEKIVLLTSEFNCSRHLIGQFLFCRDYFLSNCDRSFYKILKDIVGLNTIYM
jgi:hypothetical protein